MDIMQLLQKPVGSLRRMLLPRVRVRPLVRSMERSAIISAGILHGMNMAQAEQIRHNLQAAEFSVFSQWGDDGIISFLVDYLEITTESFIEFGVENYSEANTRYLLMSRNWSGLIMDGNPLNIAAIKGEELYWRYELTAVPAFVTAENINELISQNHFAGEIGLLHIDIDGNDYWVWKAIEVVDPIVVIVEYNSLFGADQPWTVPYDAAFRRTDKHFTNLYFGASLMALCDLAEEKGYAFVGCTSAGNNAFFVRRDRLGGLTPRSVAEGFVSSKSRESRDREGKLSFLSGDDRRRAIAGMPVVNTRTGRMERL